MILATLIVCFLLAFLPLVISAFSFRYAANIFSKSILNLSAVSFLLGLAQFGLILGLSYQLFAPAEMKRAALALQFVSIAGGVVMIVAGCLWVGYFRLLMKSKSAAKPAVRAVPAAGPAEIPPRGVATAAPVMEKAPRSVPRKRREMPEPERDWFSDEVPVARAFKLAAAVPPKTASGRRPAARTSGAKAKAQRDQ